MNSILENAAFQWTRRRVFEVGGLLTFLMSLYQAAPPSVQADVWEIIQGRGGALSVSAAIGVAVYLWTQVLSFRATTQTQIVTDGQKVVPVKEDKPAVRNTAARIERKPTLLERLTARFGS